MMEQSIPFLLSLALHAVWIDAAGAARLATVVRSLYL